MELTERESLIKQVLQDIEDYKGAPNTFDSAHKDIIGILPFDKFEWERFKKDVIIRRKIK